MQGGVQGDKHHKRTKLEVAIQEEQEEEDEKMDSNGIYSKVTFVLGEESGGSCICALATRPMAIDHWP